LSFRTFHNLCTLDIQEAVSLTHSVHTDYIIDTSPLESNKVFSTHNQNSGPIESPVTHWRCDRVAARILRYQWISANRKDFPLHAEGAARHRAYYGTSWSTTHFTLQFPVDSFHARKWVCRVWALHAAVDMYVICHVVVFSKCLWRACPVRIPAQAVA